MNANSSFGEQKGQARQVQHGHCQTLRAQLV